VTSLWVPQAVYAAAALGVAEAMGEVPRPSAAIADDVEADPGALHRLLRALAVVGLVRESEAGFALTPLGACLRADAPGSVRGWALLMGGRMCWSAWGRLADSVRTGECVPTLEGAQSTFDYMRGFPEESAIFDRSMVELTRRVAPLVAGAYDFGRFRSLVDVGGGHGALLAGILRAHPTLRGVVFDQEHCREGALRLLGDAGLAERAEFAGGDFFESVPRGADALILKSVIHDWDDARSAAILRRCRKALDGGGRLLLLEVPFPERVAARPEDAMSVFSDLNMLVMAGGRERTEAEYRALLESAGFRVERVHPTSSAFSLIDAVPV
jgi:SAM-dependent methyltransferase